MHPFSEAAFARQLRALSTAERLSFLARLWEARGYATRVDDGRVIAEKRELHAGDSGTTAEAATPARELTIAVTGPIGYGDVDTGADIVVTTRETALVRRAATGAGAEVVSPGDLLETFMYGITRETAETIASEHLGGSVVATTADDDDEISPPRWAVSAVVIGAVMIAVLVGTSGLALPIGGNVSPSDDVDVTVTESSAVTVAETDSSLPDGLNVDLADPEAATAAHNDAVEGKARELKFVYFAPENDTLPGGTTEYSATGRYLNDSRYTLEVRQSDEDGLRSHTEQFVANGVALRRQQVGNETDYERRENQSTTGWDGFRRSTIELYTAALSVNQTSIREVTWKSNERMYRLELVGKPSESILLAEQIEAVAFVSGEGRLSRLQLEYIHEPSGDQVRVVVGGRLLEDPAVARPEWYEEALNETA